MPLYAHRSRIVAVAAALSLLLLSSSASALSIVLSTVSSDETPASVLDATFAVDVLGGDTLELIVSNDTTAPNTFNINEVFISASSSVTSLALSSATHSAAGDVTADWAPVFSVIMADGFGNFDFGMTNGGGQTDPSLIGPGESVTFLLSITGACAGSYSCTAADFLDANLQGYAAAAKFVNGPGDDSAFGTVPVPEPTTLVLVGLGLGGLAYTARGRRRR